MTGYRTAIRLVHELRQGRQKSISFIKPATAVLLASEHLRLGNHSHNVQFSGGASSYSENVGLAPALRGEEYLTSGGGRTGRTYSPLAKLAEAEDVERANEIVSGCLFSNLGHTRLASEVARVIGELHDNVASHARGAGFSALQVYQESHIEFAIADCGVGLLQNARTVRRTMQSHAEAIEWAFERGNTSARNPSSMAQRLPADCLVSPFPAGVETRSSENHHKGEGLWQLQRLVSQVGGELTVHTGTATCLLAHTEDAVYGTSEVDWRGLIVEVTLPVKDYEVIPDDLEEFGRRFGI